MNLIFCLHLCLLNLLPAAPPLPVDTTARYHIRHFTDEDGLPQNSIKGIVPDKNGFLWLATENGLARFDGNYFLNFSSDNLKELKSSRMARIYPNDTAIAVENDIGEILTVSGSTVTHIGKVLPGYQYQQYKETNHDYYPIRGWPDDYAAHFAKKLPVVLPQTSDSYFSVYRDTISHVKNGTTDYRIVQPQLDLLRLFVCGNRLFYLDKDGQITGWMREHPLKIMLTGELLADPAFSKCKLELMWNPVTRQVFIYTDHACYLLQPLPDGNIRSIQVVGNLNLPESYITSIYYDEQDRRVFLGSSTKGLYICTRQQFTVHKSDASGAEVFYAQAPFPGNAVVTASGLTFHQTGGYHWLPFAADKENSLEKYTLARDPQGIYWGRDGMILMGISADFSRVLYKFELPYLIGPVHASQDGKLWIGGKYPGLYYINTAEPGQGLKFLAAGVNDVTYIKEGKIPGLLWVGTGKGLFRVQLPSGHTDTIRGLEEGNVRSIYIPKPREIWITTYNKGVFLFRDERLVALPLDRQRYMTTTHCITEDTLGYCWLTTNKGLFRVKRQDVLDYADGKQHDLFYYYFGKDQGFNTNEFNGGCQPCAFKYDNGDISLPSLDGLVHFSPAAIHMEVPDEGIFVDWMEHNGKPARGGEHVDLPNDFKAFQLHVSSPYFGDQRNLYFYYCLEKDDWHEERIWLPVSSDRTITLSSLSSGNYRIRIRKLKGFGKDQYIEKVIVVHVLEAFYEKVWFRIAVLVALICLIIWLYKIRIRRIQDQNKLLELKVLNRTQKLQETMAILQESDEQLRKQSLMNKHLLTAITHDIKTPLRFLLSVNKSEPSQKDEIKTVTYESLYRMQLLVDNLIHYMRTTFQAGDFSAETVALFPLVEEKMAIFRPVADAKGITLSNLVSPEMTVVVNQLLLAVVLHNLLDNAVKYTTRGGIEISAESGDGMVTIHVADTGSGMSRAVRDWINHSENDGTGHSASTGIGLILVKELQPAIHARLWARRRDDGGTILSLQLRQNG
ncbi:sensor histidine kinase [Chitinophaga qingshengii]|uniref:histidine kinase n=1 Tax=Chitinophaga qingshengii TaxID=1569794 RepID=A0ABR7TQJ3_9BACT|nr:ATP-binding protein [Chitinophaga qingshengii]MBC9932751.1 hypothetical protein [Chitinophaga qingshengii]